MGMILTRRIFSLFFQAYIVIYYRNNLENLFRSLPFKFSTLRNLPKIISSYTIINNNNKNINNYNNYYYIVHMHIGCLHIRRN